MASSTSWPRRSGRRRSRTRRPASGGGTLIRGGRRMADSPEFDLIKRHFTRPAANAVLGVGDDCALVDVTNGMDLTVSTDTMVSGTHFFPDVNPEHLGHKALAVNLSDIPAMGAMPYWPMLVLTVPNVDHVWLR